MSVSRSNLPIGLLAINFRRRCAGIARSLASCISRPACAYVNSLTRPQGDRYAAKARFLRTDGFFASGLTGATDSASPVAATAPTLGGLPSRICNRRCGVRRGIAAANAGTLLDDGHPHSQPVSFSPDFRGLHLLAFLRLSLSRGDATRAGLEAPHFACPRRRLSFHSPLQSLLGFQVASGNRPLCELAIRPGGHETANGRIHGFRRVRHAFFV